MIEDEAPLIQNIATDLILENDQTWIVSGITTIATDASITVQPGTMIKFEENARLEVFGELSSFIAVVAIGHCYGVCVFHHLCGLWCHGAKYVVFQRPRRHPLAAADILDGHDRRIGLVAVARGWITGIANRGDRQRLAVLVGDFVLDLGVCACALNRSCQAADPHAD